VKLFLDGFKHDVFVLGVPFLAFKDQRHREVEAKFVVLVGQDQHIHFAKAAFANQPRSDDILLGLAHDQLVDNVGVLEGVISDRRQKQELAVLVDHVVLLPSLLATKLHVEVPQAVFSHCLQRKLAVSLYLMRL